MSRDAYSSQGHHNTISKESSYIFKYEGSIIVIDESRICARADIIRTKMATGSQAKDLVKSCAIDLLIHSLEFNLKAQLTEDPKDQKLRKLGADLELCRTSDEKYISILDEVILILAPLALNISLDEYFLQNYEDQSDEERDDILTTHVHSDEEVEYASRQHVRSDTMVPKKSPESSTIYASIQLPNTSTAATASKNTEVSEELLDFLGFLQDFNGS